MADSAQNPAKRPRTERHFKMRVRRAAQIVTVCSSGEDYKTGPALDHVHIIENATLIIDDAGRVAAVGPDAELDATFADAVFDSEIDAVGKSIIPGLVDAHTHCVFAGDRVHEFDMKLRGATYMEIHAAGGGIGFTVQHVKRSSEDELWALLRPRLDRMLRYGTVLLEGKSGYGLELETEAKMLRVLRRASAAHPIDISATYCGAHSVPKTTTAALATEDIVTHQIPAIMAMKAAGQLDVDSIDVFFEKGVFERDDTRRILQAGRDVGLLLNYHADEINPVGGGELAQELGARAVSHLERITDEGITAMAATPTVAVLLPTTALILNLHPPPARKLINANVPVALGSDFNPNAHCLSMAHTMHLACVMFRMTMNEALNAATINAAYSVNRHRDYGSLEVGKFGSFVLIGNPDWRHIAYEVGDPPIDAVVVKGRIEYERP